MNIDIQFIHYILPQNYELVNVLISVIISRAN